MPAVRSATQVGYTRFDARAVIHLPREVGVVAAWDVTQHVPLPLKSDCMSIMSIGRFAHQCQSIAHFHLIPYRLHVVVNSACERSVLNDNAC